MDYSFIFIQIVGVLAWLMLVLSYYRKDTNSILIFHIIGNLFYCIHYGLLGAWSGLFICCTEALFDFGYFKTDKDKYIYLVSIPIRIIGGLFSYRLWVDFLPIVASLIDGYTLTKSKRVVVYGAMISYSLWVAYDLYVGSYSGAVTSGIIVVSNLLIFFFNYDIFKRKNRKEEIIRR